MTEASLAIIVTIVRRVTSLWVAAITMSLSPASLSQPQPVASYEIVDDAIERPLSGLVGDAGRGRAIAAGRQGNCLACHAMPIPEEGFHGNVGPDLTGVGSRYSAGELRLRLVDGMALNPDTIMPSFHRVEGLHRVKPELRGRPILNAQQVEDVVAYLMTLTED